MLDTARYGMSNARSISGNCQEIRAIQLHLHAKLFERKKKSFMNKRKTHSNLLWISTSSDQLQLPLPSPSLSPSTSHNHSHPSHTTPITTLPLPLTPLTHPTNTPPTPSLTPPPLRARLPPYPPPPPLPPTCNSHFTTKPPYSISVSFPVCAGARLPVCGWEGVGGCGMGWDGCGGS